MSGFHIGQLVVCIARVSPTCYAETTPVVGTVYTVREKFEHHLVRRPAVRLEEIVNAPKLYVFDGVCEASFPATAFRPVDDTRLEIFRKALQPVPVGENA